MLLASFLKDRELRGVCTKTLAWYQDMLAPWTALQEPANMPLRLHRYLEQWVNPQSRRSVFGAVRAFEMWKAKRDRVFPWIKDVVIHWPETPQPSLLTQTEFDRILAQLDPALWTDLRDATLFKTLWWTGARLSAILWLKRGDLDMENHSCRIKTKGGKIADIVIAQPALDALRQWLPCLDMVCEWLFPSTRTLRPMRREWPNHRLKALAHLAGIEKRVWVHCLRHSYATRLVESGVDVALVQRQLLHSNLSTTLRYARIGLSSVRRAIDMALNDAECEQPSSGYS